MPKNHAEAERVLKLIENMGGRLSKIEEQDLAISDIPGSLAEGDLLIVDSTPELIRLAIGTTSQHLVVSAGRPAWIDHVFDGVTVTVGSGKDYATIQGAIDSFSGAAIFGTNYIDVDAGTYDEAVDFSSLLLAGGATLTLRGDARVLAGLSYVDGSRANLLGLANGGSGTCAISNAGAVVTVTGTTTNPDFDADGWGSGDRVLIYNNAGAIAEYTIDSVLNNAITLTVAAPAIGDDATAIVLLPDRRIVRTTAGPCIYAPIVRGIGVNGFYLETATGVRCHGIDSFQGGLVSVENCVAYAEDVGFYAEIAYAALLSSGGAVSAWGCTQGFFANDTGQVRVPYAIAVGCTTGFYCQTQSYIQAFACIAVNATAGFYCQRFSMLFGFDGTARQNTTGYHGLTRGYIEATNSNAQNNGNGTNYNPAVSDTFGNSNASITWS